MSTIALPPTSITADQYASILGKPAHRAQALLQPVGCPTCTGPLRNTGWADWVKEHGIIVTLWTCLNSDCRELRYRNDFRLETAVYPHPDEKEPLAAPTVEPTAAWIAAHRDCQHFDGTCRHGDVDYVPAPAEPEVPAYRAVVWHPEHLPAEQSEAVLCDYHHRLAVACFMVVRDLGPAATPDCTVCG